MSSMWRERLKDHKGLHNLTEQCHYAIRPSSYKYKVSIIYKNRAEAGGGGTCLFAVDIHRDHRNG